MSQNTKQDSDKGFIFNIEHNAIHDGPGIRTVVFLKGCPLKCFWCQNPAGIGYEQEIQLTGRRCIECRACVEACPNDAHYVGEDQRTYDRDRCELVGDCVAACPTGALQYTRTTKTVDEVVEEVLDDRAYYDTSGGGVTLSGGEPLVQDQFARRILEQCASEGISTAVETCLHVPWQNIESVLPHLDLVMMDIKHIDPEPHQEATGVGTERILNNAKRLSETSMPLIVRTPVIPGLNDSEETIGEIATLLAGFDNLQYYELLPFHRLGESKYHSLGMEYPADDLETPSDDHMEVLATRARSKGIEVRIGEI